MLRDEIREDAVASDGGTDFAHLDTYAWRDSASPGRPKGGDALGLRAVHAMLGARYTER